MPETLNNKTILEKKFKDDKPVHPVQVCHYRSQSQHNAGLKFYNAHL